MIGELERQETTELDEFTSLLQQDPTIREQVSLLTRKYQSRQHAVEQDPMLYADDIFSIDPAEGELWPNSEVEVTIVFKPVEARTYTRTLFCDVSGRETRLPLRLKGEGRGPHARFSFDSLALGSIFHGSTHVYEVGPSPRCGWCTCAHI